VVGPSGHKLIRAGAASRLEGRHGGSKPSGGGYSLLGPWSVDHKKDPGVGILGLLVDDVLEHPADDWALGADPVDVVGRRGVGAEVLVTRRHVKVVGQAAVQIVFMEVVGLRRSRDGFGVVASHGMDILDGVVDLGEDPIHGLDLSGLAEGLRPDSFQSINTENNGLRQHYAFLGRLVPWQINMIRHLHVVIETHHFIPDKRHERSENFFWKYMCQGGQNIRSLHIKLVITTEPLWFTWKAPRDWDHWSDPEEEDLVLHTITIARAWTHRTKWLTDLKRMTSLKHLTLELEYRDPSKLATEEKVKFTKIVRGLLNKGRPWQNRVKVCLKDSTGDQADSPRLIQDQEALQD
jgi:hypothetical protein